MIGALVGWFSAMAIGLGDIDFAANDWFYPCFLSCHIKINNSIHGAVVGDSKTVHAQLFGTGNKLGDAAHAIEQTIFGVDVKVGKLFGHWLDYSICGKSTKRGISHSQKFLHIASLLSNSAHFGSGSSPGFYSFLTYHALS